MIIAQSDFQLKDPLEARLPTLLACAGPRPREDLLVVRESPETLLERLNAGLVLALAFCVAIWMVLVGFVEGYVL